MMNKSDIDWTDFSWNPITGCRHGCPYCYANNQARRFCGDIRLNKASPQLHQGPKSGLWTLEKPFKNMNGRVIPYPVGFEPTFHKYRLADPFLKKKPATIFVGSMADAFGPWVPDEWVYEVFNACKEAPWHKYIFLTKNPWRYVQLEKTSLLPTSENMWYGTSAGSADQIKKALSLGELPGKYNTFLSIEPLHEDISITEAWLEIIGVGTRCNSWASWIIVGAETGNQRKILPEKEWVEKIVAECAAKKIPVFLKENLQEIWGKRRKLIQQFPDGLILPPYHPLPKHRVYIEAVRDKKQCGECEKELQGLPAWRLGARIYNCVPCFEKRLSEEK